MKHFGKFKYMKENAAIYSNYFLVKVICFTMRNVFFICYFVPPEFLLVDVQKYVFS